MPIQTYYTALKVDRLAPLSEIKAAYRTILLANHPDKTQHLAPFARTLADRTIRAANAVWEVLSEPTKKAAYDAELPAWDAFDSSDAWRVPRESTPFGAPSPERGFPPHRPRTPSPYNSGGYNNANASDDQPSSSTESHTPSPPLSTTNETPSRNPQAEYRYGLTRIATDIDIKIKGWSLYLLLSTKFRFLNTVTQLRTPSTTDNTIAFELHLERNKSWRPIGTEFFAWRNPELIIGINKIATGAKSIGQIRTLFKEVTKSTLILIICISPAEQNQPVSALPWTFGFDFDMNSHPAAWGRKRGTCMVFTHGELGTADVPEDVLKSEEGLVANAFCGLGDVKGMGVEYKGVRMWRSAAVGYRTGTFLR